MDTQVKSDSLVGIGQNEDSMGSDCKMQSKGNQQNQDLPEKLSSPEISQVEDEYSNSTALTLAESSQTDDDPEQTFEVETGGCAQRDDNPDMNMESDEDMTIYETNAELDENATASNLTQSVPECSQSFLTISSTEAETEGACGHNFATQANLQPSLQMFDNWINTIDRYLHHSHNDELEQLLQVNLAATTNANIQEVFGIAATQIELINQILFEKMEK